MRTRRKLSNALALCLALLLALSLLGTSALAIGPSDTGTITVSGVEDGVTVSAYRLMTVNINETSQQPQEPVYTWVDGVASWVRTNYAAYIGTDQDNSVQAAFSTAGAEDLAAFYDALAAAIRGSAISGFNPAKTETASGSSVALTGMPMGNYLILIEGGGRIYRPSAVNLVPTWNDGQWDMSTPAVVEIKSSEPTIDKTVNDKEEDNANIGDTVTFDIVADIPQFPANAISKNYAISDTLSSGLTFNSESLQVYGVSGSEETLLTGEEGGAYTQGNQRPGGGSTTFTLTFDYDAISTYEKIHITYTATLNEDAVLGENGNPNDAQLDYTDDPYEDEDWGGTDDDQVTVYTYGLDITKVDKDNHGTTLSGAEFELYASSENAVSGENKILFVMESSGVYHKAMPGAEGTTTTLVVDASGKLTIKGLDEGTWYLKETKAPNGYNLLAGPIEVTITDTANEDLDGKVENAAGTSGESVALVALTVENDDGFQLPTTGGMGTVLFTAVGVVLMGAAVLLLVLVLRKKKAGN